MKEPFKIQINSLEALERLIGNDTEMELQLRQSVVEAFATKHLKALVNTELMKSVEQKVLLELNTQVFDVVGSGYSTKRVLQDKYAFELKKSIEVQVQSVYTELIKEILQKNTYEVQIAEMVARQVDYIVNAYTNGDIERRIQIGVQQRLKEKLGLS